MERYLIKLDEAKERTGIVPPKRTKARRRRRLYQLVMKPLGVRSEAELERAIGKLIIEAFGEEITRSVLGIRSPVASKHHCNIAPKLPLESLKELRRNRALYEFLLPFLERSYRPGSGRPKHYVVAYTQGLDVVQRYPVLRAKTAKKHLGYLSQRKPLPYAFRTSDVAVITYLTHVLPRLPRPYNDPKRRRRFIISRASKLGGLAKDPCEVLRRFVEASKLAGRPWPPKFQLASLRLAFVADVEYFRRYRDMHVFVAPVFTSYVERDEQGKRRWIPHPRKEERERVREAPDAIQFDSLEEFVCSDELRRFIRDALLRVAYDEGLVQGGSDTDVFLVAFNLARWVLAQELRVVWDVKPELRRIVALGVKELV